MRLPADTHLTGLLLTVSQAFLSTSGCSNQHHQWTPAHTCTPLTALEDTGDCCWCTSGACCWADLQDSSMRQV